MAQEQPNPDAFTAPFQLTKGMHRDMYGPMDPKNPDLNAAGKVVIITGAAGGLGFKIAQAWATAGAKGIVLAGRSAPSLEETAKGVEGLAIVAAGDITKPEDARAIVDKAVAEFGKADVLINAAGHMNHGAMTGDVDPSLWWEDYEVNVRGTYNMCHHFIKATGGKGMVVNLVSLGASFLVPGLSSYSSSKLAVIKLGEYLNLENPELRVFSVHPGMVEAENGRGIVVPAFNPFAKDKALLTAAVTLYLQQACADFLRGGYYSVNWDIEELTKHKQEVMEKNMLQLAFINGKMQPGGYSWEKAD